ncbi:protein of unknown function DUF885 [Fibrella aestuarina BUZ 2]|uniref:DUF885 domain-containing protein n=1 Tax=Fibrella aestuarina BUZ 2 TaxID=1166018 RepID=I0K4L3_9BACT|nr:DUF885 domain-containing protein [Fibrella aestuarina]CCG99066.1 protein of unknown function DUF885 [Fibrella aestuarina BUZ 2]
MRFAYPTLLLATLLVACQRERGNVPSFSDLSRQYLDAYYASNPEAAVYLGNHAYDGQLPIPTKSWWQQQRTQLAHFDSALAQLDTAQLSVDEQIDYRLIRANILGELNDIDSLRASEDPYSYNVDFSTYVERSFGIPAGRMQSLINKARLMPDYVAAVKENLSANPSPEHVQVSIDVFNGTADYLLGDVRTAFSKVGNAGQQTELQSATKLAADALHGLADHLKRHILPTAKGSFAIGTGNFRRMLLYNEQLNANPDSILRVGLAQLKREQIEFTNAARIIDPNRPAIEVFRSIQRDHPTADKLVSSTQAHCEAIRQFLLDKQLISIPSEVRATVTKTPEFMVGATAAMNTPGPFEKEATQAYYYVTLPKASWPARQQEEWLTQYNRYVAEVISIHEAYPGHYVQFLHLNASKVSEVRKVFSSYAFVEGWAHYTEQMMLEEGYPGGDVWRDPKTAARYKMAQLSESLLRYCRLVCAINLHTHGWTVDQATRFIQANCYYEEKPAREEAIRGTYDPGYLSYSLGKLQLLALRDRYQQKMGKKASLRGFHNAVLAQGMLPVSELARVLLR